MEIESDCGECIRRRAVELPSMSKQRKRPQQQKLTEELAVRSMGECTSGRLCGSSKVFCGIHQPTL